MKLLLKIIMITLAVSVLTACSKVPSKYDIFRSHSDDYLKARPVGPLKIPPGYSSNSVEDYYPIPNAQGAKSTKASPLLPPNLNPKDAPPPIPWWKRWIPHAHMPWDPPGK